MSAASTAARVPTSDHPGCRCSGPFCEPWCTCDSCAFRTEVVYVVDRSVTFGDMVAELVEILAEDGGGAYVLGETGRDPDGTVKVSFTPPGSPTDPEPLRNALAIGRHCRTAMSEIRNAVELLREENGGLTAEQRSLFTARLSAVREQLGIVDAACTDRVGTPTTGPAHTGAPHSPVREAPPPPAPTAGGHAGGDAGGDTEPGADAVVVSLAGCRPGPDAAGESRPPVPGEAARRQG